MMIMTTNDSSRNYNPKFGNQNTSNTTAPVRTFGKPNNTSQNNGSGVGNFIRKVFSGDNTSNYNHNNSDNSTPSRNIKA